MVVDRIDVDRERKNAAENRETVTDEEKRNFTETVLDLVALIPAGRVTTYGKLARAAGDYRQSRLVGRIMAGCASRRPGLPAHRVVGSSGRLSGCAAFGPGEEMAELLAREGINILHQRVCNFRKLLWDPLEEL